MNQDLGRRKHLRVASGVISVMMRIDHIPDGLARNLLHGRQHFKIVLVEAVVHQDDAFTCHVDGDIAGVGRAIRRAFDQVQIVVELLDRQRGLGKGSPRRENTG